MPPSYPRRRDDGWRPRDAFDLHPNLRGDDAPPKARDPGEFTDCTYRAPPPSRLSLAYTSIDVPRPPKGHPLYLHPDQIKGPVPSLLSLTALQLARNLDLVEPEHLKEGTPKLSVEAMRALASCLVEPDWDDELGGMVRLGNWVNLGMQWGQAVMLGLPEIEGRNLSGVPSFFDLNPPPLPTELVPTTHHRTLPVHAAELINSLKATPCVSPLLEMSKTLCTKQRMNILTSLSLAGTDFEDKDASCLRVLGCLVGLDLDRTRAGDATVMTLASALFVPPESAGERRGLWQLKAWSMRGCGKVADGSAKSFRKFTRLTYLDVSQTSCTVHVFPNLLSSTWSPSPAASLHSHVNPPQGLLPTPLSLHIHHPIPKGLRPTPFVPNRPLGSNARVSAPLTRTLPPGGEDAPPTTARRSPSGVKRAPEEEPAVLKKRKLGGGSADDLMALLAGGSAPSTKVKAKGKPYTNPFALRSSSPAKEDDPFRSSSPVRPPPGKLAASLAVAKTRQIRPAPPSPTSSHSSDVQIISPPPKPKARPPKPVPGAGLTTNPFGVSKGLPLLGSGSKSSGGPLVVERSKVGFGAGPVKRTAPSKAMEAPKKTMSGLKRGAEDVWKAPPKERRKIGEGSQASLSAGGDGVGLFYFKKKAGKGG